MIRSVFLLQPYLSPGLLPAGFLLLILHHLRIETPVIKALGHGQLPLDSPGALISVLLNGLPFHDSR